MRATVMFGAGDVHIETVPDARLIEPTDALVVVTRAAICGSDLWPYKTMEYSETGRRMGHEAIGVVEAVGADGLDDADGLVAHAAAGLAVFHRLVRPEIAAADGSAGDDDEGIGRLNQAGVGDGLDMDIAGAEHHSCMHRVSYLRFPAGCGSLRA